jgi:hypothetical protein
MRQVPALVAGIAGAGSNPLRVVRGGAFWNEPRNVRCAVRNWNDPSNRNDNIGFRVVVSTLFVLPALPGGAARPSGPRRRMAEPAPGRVRDSGPGE